MRLLIVGGLSGQLSAAAKIAMDRGARVAFSPDVEAALTAPGMESDLAPKDQRFFIHKAVGWALRQYAWTDPAEVKRYVAAHPELPGLSQREALKNL